MERRDFIVSTYKHLGVAILAFVVLSAVLMVSGLSTATAKMLMASGNKFIWLGVMGAFMLVGWLASHQADNAESPQTQLMGLVLYVLAEGLIFAPLFGIAQIVAPGAIGAAGFITLLMVAALTWTANSPSTSTRRAASRLGAVIVIVFERVSKAAAVIAGLALALAASPCVRTILEHSVEQHRWFRVE